MDASHCYINQTLIDKLVITESFSLRKGFCNKLRHKEEPFGNDLSHCTFYRTYSRKKEDGTNERWADTIIRVVNGTMSAYITHMMRNHLQIRSDITKFAENMALALFNRQWMPPGRGLYCMGTDIVKYRGNAALNNCYAVETKTDLVKAASWAMDMLMCGGGVGFDVTWVGGAYPPNKEDYEIYKVPDSRQGWVSALELLVRAYIPIDGEITNKFPRFDYSEVREYGKPIKGFGGTASGPEPLRVLLERVEVFLDTYIKYKEDGTPENLKRIYIEQVQTLKSKNAYDIAYEVNMEELIENIKLSVDNNYELKEYNEVRVVTDIFNAIASCVVAGNVRRSSEIAIGDAGHDEVSDKNCNIFINLKNYTVNPERGPWAWNSNNTIRLHRNEDFEKWIPLASELIKTNGEPGLYNMINVGKYGRYSDTSRRYDEGTLINPCGEIVLCSYEPCTLAIVCPYNCRTDMSSENSELNEEAILRAAEFATFYASVVTTIPHHWQDSNAIIARNRRIGVSFAGITNIYENYGQNILTTLSRKMYHHISDYNAKFAAHAGIPAAIRVTTIKPEGTTSLITELNAGIHFSMMRYCIRRVNLSADSPLVEAFEEAGYTVENSVYTPKTKIIEFPMFFGNGRPAEEVPMFEQFSLLMTMQRHYSDNSCSDTITFNKETEGNTVANAISAFIPQLKTVSLLGKEANGDITGYKQLPYEKISKEKYEEILKGLKPINWNKLYDGESYSDGIDQRYCTNDTCIL